MSKFLTVIIAFAFVVTGMVTHTFGAVSVGHNNDLAKSLESHKCHTLVTLETLETDCDETNKKELLHCSAHCAFDLIFMSRSAVNNIIASVPVELLFFEKHLKQTHPEFLGKPPKA